MVFLFLDSGKQMVSEMNQHYFQLVLINKGFKDRVFCRYSNSSDNGGMGRPNIVNLFKTATRV